MTEIERILNAKEKKIKKKSLLSTSLKKIKNYLRLKFPNLNQVLLQSKKKYLFGLGNEYIRNMSTVEQPKYNRK
jgi:hypothetical protein